MFLEQGKKKLEKILTDGYLAEVESSDLALARRKHRCCRIDVISAASTDDQCIVH